MRVDRWDVVVMLSGDVSLLVKCIHHGIQPLNSLNLSQMYFSYEGDRYIEAGRAQRELAAVRTTTCGGVGGGGGFGGGAAGAKSSTSTSSTSSCSLYPSVESMLVDTPGTPATNLPKTPAPPVPGMAMSTSRGKPMQGFPRAATFFRELLLGTWQPSTT